MEWRRCSSCGDLKTIDNFYFKNKNTGEERVARCKDCEKEYRQRNKEKRKEYDKNRYYSDLEYQKEKNRKGHEKHRDKRLEKQKEYRENNKEKIYNKQKEYVERNKEKIREYLKEYNKINKTHINDIKNEYHKNKRHSDANIRLKDNVSSAVRKILSSRKNNRRVEELIGYKISELKEHIEKQLPKEWNWENYGSEWSIDHIIPLRVFNFFDETEIKKCWDLRNLRPLSFKDNSSKAGVLNFKLIEQYNISDLLPDTLVLDEGIEETKMNTLSNYEFEKLIEKFVNKLENHGELDNKLKSDILKASTVWNKEEIMEDLIKQIKIFKDYDEKEVNFPFKRYVERLLS